MHSTNSIAAFAAVCSNPGSSRGGLAYVAHTISGGDRCEFEDLKRVWLAELDRLELLRYIVRTPTGYEATRTGREQMKPAAQTLFEVASRLFSVLS